MCCILEAFFAIYRWKSLCLLYICYSRPCKMNLHSFISREQLLSLLVETDFWFCFVCVFVPLFHPPSFMCVTVKACFQDNVVFSLQCHDIQRQSHGNCVQNVSIYKLLTELPSCQLALQQALNSNCIRFEVLFQRAFPPQNFSSFCFLIARQEFQPRKVSCSFQQLPQLHVHLVQPCSHLGLPWGLDQFHQVRLRLEIRGEKKICFKLQSRTEIFYLRRL